jgi:hypothetical protein
VVACWEGNRVLGSHTHAAFKFVLLTENCANAITYLSSRVIKVVKNVFFTPHKIYNINSDYKFES